MQESAPAAAAEKRRSGLAFAGELLRHPLVLLLVGGALSALTAAFVTQRWQDRQRRLDVQRSFVADMTHAAMSDLGALDRFDGALRGYPASDPAELRRAWAVADHADLAWVVDSFTIAARLDAYYPGRGIAQAWTGVQAALEALWACEQLDYQALIGSGGEKGTLRKPRPRKISEREYTRLKAVEDPIRGLLGRAVAVLLRRPVGPPPAALTAGDCSA